MIDAKTYGGFLISQVKQLQARLFERLLKETGVDAFNGAQGRILYVLWERERLTITQIARLTSLANTTLTSMLDRMQEGGLIRRMPDSANRRQILVHITDKARSYKKEYDAVSERMNELFYTGFSPEEIEAFERQLKVIILNLQSEEERA